MAMCEVAKQEIPVGMTKGGRHPLRVVAEQKGQKPFFIPLSGLNDHSFPGSGISLTVKWCFAFRDRS